MFRAILAFVIAAFATAASAQTIVQTSTNRTAVAQGALLGFDYSLGTLDSVMLLIQSTENRNFIGHAGLWPIGAPDIVDLTWTVNGTSGFHAFGLGGGQPVQFFVPISGTGTVQVSALDRLFFPQLNGSAEFSIDPTLIPQLGSTAFPGYDFAIRFFGPGYYDGSDVQFSSSYPVAPRAPAFFCAEETCNQFVYTLTYNYTPAVPEPGTWAMMLMGFGAVGFAMRRKRMPRRAVA